MKAERQEKNGRVVVTFYQGPIEALESGERFLPSDTPVYPQVTFSTGTSSQKVAEAYAQVVDQQVQRGNVADLAAQLTKGKSTPDEKLAAIIQYLAKEIRYT